MGPNQADLSEIEGAVHAITFHNDENGYSIFQAQTSESINATTVLGVLPAITIGESFKAKGEWHDNPKFGKQFKATHIYPQPPQTAKAVEQFLSSGLIDGIGKLYAKRIVAKFGKETLDIIENHSQKLEQVEGIGKKRRLEIKNSWIQKKAVREIMLFLHGHGLSPSQANRLYKEYGDRATHILRQNPYQLVADLPGVGFKTADDIARKMGQADNSPKRVAAGLHHIVEVAAGKGHCCLPQERLISETTAILQTEPELVQTTLAELLRDEQLVAEGEMIYGLDCYRAECQVADILRSMCDQPARHADLDAEKAIAHFQEKNQIQLGNEQAQAVAGALRHRSYIITGGPGVGKTTILNAILQILTSATVRTVLCAPTGRAAKRLSDSTGREASTIHRLLEFQPGGGFAKNRTARLEGDLFVVDEASMIDIHLMASFLDALPDKAHIILVGDVDQLPSVGPGTVLRDLIESAAIPVARLTEIYRQAATSLIVGAAHQINAGNMPTVENAADSDFFFFERQSGQSIIDTLQTLIQQRIPQKFGLHPRDDIQVLTPMNRNTLGTKSLNEQLQAATNPEDSFKPQIERYGRIYRTGDKVIQTKNNYDNEVFNGDIGHIAEITPDPAKVIVHFEGNREVSYDPNELDELQLAYAITIHKSQGSEFPAVIVPLASEQYILLQRNLIYTAITRGKKLVILVGEKRALSTAVNNADSLKRWTGLSGRLSD